MLLRDVIGLCQRMDAFRSRLYSSPNRRIFSAYRLLRLWLLRVVWAKRGVFLAENYAPIPISRQFTDARFHDLHIHRSGPDNRNFHLRCRLVLRNGFRCRPNLRMRYEFLSASESRRLA